MLKLVHNRYGFSFLLEENKMNELVIENPQVFTELVKELQEQCEGGEGGFVLSLEHKILAIEKNVSFIRDPFAVDGSSRKILTKLYQELEGCIREELCEAQAEFYQGYLKYMDAICEKSDFYLTYNEEPGCQDILKMANVKLDIQTDILLERIVEYIKAANRLLGQNIFIFLNLKLFLTKDEIEKLYQECFYRKIHLILLEAIFQGKCSGENVCMIDKDKCIIYS